MACFSNSTEFMQWQSEYCDQCVNWPDDPNDGCYLVCVLLAVDDAENDDHWLNNLIPTDQDNKCKMFRKKTP